MTETRTPQRETPPAAPAARAAVPRAEPRRVPAGPPPRRRPAPVQRSNLIYSILLWSVVTIAALAVAAGTFLFIAAPTDLVRDQLIQQVRERTGRDVYVAGQTSFRIVPDVGVSLERVSLSAPTNMGGDPMLRIAEVEAKLQLWPLLRGEVRIDRLILRRPEINLRIDSSGRRTWDFAQATDPAPPFPRMVYAQLPGGRSGAREKDPLRSIALNDVRIDDGTVRYIDDRRNIWEEFNDLNMRFALPALTVPLEAKGTVDWRRQRMRVNLKVESPKSLVSGAASPIALRIAGRPMEATYSGSVAAAQRGLDGEVTIKADSLSALASWLGKPLPKGEGQAPFELKGNVKVGEASSELTNADITLDETRIRGKVSLDGWNGTRPRVDANLHLSELDLNRWLRHGEHRGRSRGSDRGNKSDAPAQSIDDLLKRDGNPAGGSGTVEPQVRGFIARHGWSDVEFNLASLGLIDGNIRLAADRVLYRDVKTGTAQIQATIDNRVLTARLEDLQIYEGKGRGIMRLDASGPDPTLQARFEFDDVSAFELLRDSSEFDWIAGKGRVTIAVAGRGRSELQMVETLTGDAQFAFHDGALVGYDIPQIIRGLQQGRISGLDRNLSQKTQFSELAATFKITNGIAENRDFRLVSPLVAVSGTGKADLPRRTLDYMMRPKLVASLPGQTGTQSLAGLEVPVKITGSWDHPNIKPDLDGILKDPDKAVEAVKEIGRQLKGKDVNEIVRGFLGSEGDENDNKTKKKAREFLRQFIKPDQKPDQ